MLEPYRPVDDGRLTELQRYSAERRVGHMLVGGLARVARGSDEVTRGVDICPALQAANLDRLATALTDMGAARRDGEDLAVDEARLQAESVIELSTSFGELKIVATPAGVPRGFDALRAGATKEHLGQGCAQRSPRPAI